MKVGTDGVLLGAWVALGAADGCCWTWARARA